MTDHDKVKESTLKKLILSQINGTTAAEILKLTVRQVRRLRNAFLKFGVKGILHKNRGKISNRSIPKSTKVEVVRLIKLNYPDFGPTLACEKLNELNQISLSPETVRQIMIEERLWRPKLKTSEQFPHVWRLRKECFGDMQQYDGSYHNWFEERLKNSQGEEVTLNCFH